MGREHGTEYEWAQKKREIRMGRETLKMNGSKKRVNAKEWEENMKCTRCTEDEKRKREMRMEEKTEFTKFTEYEYGKRRDIHKRMGRENGIVEDREKRKGKYKRNGKRNGINEMYRR